jgi:hypothetical protein
VNEDKNRDISIEILRIGLIAIRNISTINNRNHELQSKLREWAELCHSLPQILLGGCDERAVKYFLEGDALVFVKNYPEKNGADFLQAKALINELSNLIN